MTTLAELNANLQHELGLCRRLLAILKLTRQTLTKHDPAQLETCVEQQALLADDLAAAEAARQPLLAVLAPEYGLPADATLSALIAALPGDAAGPLAALAESLGGILAEIAQIQEVNRALLQHALDYVDFNMELVAAFERQTTAPTTYGSSALTASAASAYRDVPASSVVNLNA